MNWKNYFPKGLKENEKAAKCVTEYTYMEDSNL
jgi:hypothetical protein